MSFDGDLTKYENDFRFLMEMKGVLIEELLRMKGSEGDPTFSDSELKSGIYTETSDRREVRIVLPSGLHTVLNFLEASSSTVFGDTVTPHVLENNDITSLRQKEMCFVGFIGYKSDAGKNDANLVREIFATDCSMLKELPEVDGMIAYVTGERAEGGNYGNLVLFRERSVLQNLFKSQNHAKAISSLSPRYYSEVRIHSGILPTGLTSYFVLQKTLFLQFSLPPEDPGRRRVQMWRASREDSDVVKVLPTPVTGLGTR